MGFSFKTQLFEMNESLNYVIVEHSCRLPTPNTRSVEALTLKFMKFVSSSSRSMFVCVSLLTAEIEQLGQPTNQCHVNCTVAVCFKYITERTFSNFLVDNK